MISPRLNPAIAAALETSTELITTPLSLSFEAELLCQPRRYGLDRNAEQDSALTAVFNFGRDNTLFRTFRDSNIKRLLLTVAKELHLDFSALGRNGDSARELAQLFYLPYR